MIKNIKENIGKEFLYVLPVTPNGRDIENYIVAKVKIIKFSEHGADVKIVEVYNENSRAYLKYCKENRATYGCSLKYLFELNYK